jgi:heme exporter protein A
VSERAAAALAIEAQGLAHRYAPGRGLEAVSFTLTGPGSALIAGANGAGKSTLLRIVAGLLRPSAGSLQVSESGRALDPAARRMRVGFASPDLQFYDELSAAENLEFAAAARGLSEPQGAAREALVRVGLEARARDRVPALSSGMRQRLRLAFALLGRPPLLLIDEPGSHLDEGGRAALRAIVDEERRHALVLVAGNEEGDRSLGGEKIELRGGGLGRPS